MSGEGGENNFLVTVVLPALLLMGTAFVLYWGSFNHAWTYDDFPVILNNPDVRSLADFRHNHYPGRPLRELSYLLDHALFGFDPAGWHVQSIFWHGLCGVLVFLLALRLHLGRLVGFGAALLFLTHPLQVEVVASIAHRKDSLVLAFSLLALLAYTRVFGDRTRRAGWLLLSALLTLLALAAKENAIALPLVMLAYERTYVAAPDRLLLRWPRLWPVLGGVAASAGAVWLVRMGGAEAFARAGRLLLQKANIFGSFDAIGYYWVVFKAWAFQLIRFVFPRDLALEYTFSMPLTAADPWVLSALASVGIYLLLLGLAWHRRSPLLLPLVWAGAFWLPVSNLWPLNYFAADRYLYAPSVGLCLLLALLLGHLCGRLQKLAVGVLVVVAMVWSVLSWQQNQVWHDSLTLWTNAVAVSPKASLALNNLGYEYRQRGDVLKAREYYGRAVENPYNAIAHYNLATVLEELGEGRRAYIHYLFFLRLDPPHEEEKIWVRKNLARRYGISTADDLRQALDTLDRNLRREMP